MKFLTMLLMVPLVIFSIPIQSGVAEETAVLDEHAGHEHGAMEMVSEVQQTPAAPDMAPVKRPDGIIDLNNKVCPVSKEAVSGKDFYEHDGINYSLCCKMCIRDFKKDPAKYAVDKESILQSFAGEDQSFVSVG